MAKFSYQAITNTGASTSGTLDAESLEAASNALVARGYIPTRIRETARGMSGVNLAAIQNQLRPIKIPDIILFTKQFRTMIRAGVSMMNLLQVLERQTENPKLQRVLQAMQQDISEGASLHSAFRKHPRIFSPLYCSMVEAGEASGALPEILDRLTMVLDHEYKVKTDIKSALQYPLVVVSFLAIAFIVLLTFVIPKFVNIFKEANLELPLPTVICMYMYQFVANYWYLVIGGGLALVIGLGYYLRTPQGRYVLDSVLLETPVIGPLLLKSAVSRFASIFAILHSSGVDVLDSMDILSGTLGNQAIARELDKIKDRLEEGRGMAEPLSQSKYFTPMLINMVAIGEETGNLHDMLSEVAGHYDTEVEYAMHKLSEAIGPLLVIGLAAVIGFFALAIFLPMWDLTTMVR